MLCCLAPALSGSFLFLPFRPASATQPPVHRPSLSMARPKLPQAQRQDVPVQTCQVWHPPGRCKAQQAPPCKMPQRVRLAHEHHQCPRLAVWRCCRAARSQLRRPCPAACCWAHRARALPLPQGCLLRRPAHPQPPPPWPPLPPQPRQRSWSAAGRRTATRWKTWAPAVHAHSPLGDKPVNFAALCTPRIGKGSIRVASVTAAGSVMYLLKGGC